MINLDEKTDIINETLKKISFILNQSRKQELNRESFIKDILRLIFCDEKDLNKIRFPNISSESKNEFNLVIKFVDLLYYIFGLPKITREKIYDNKLKNHNDKTIINFLEKLNFLSNNVKCIGSSKIDELFNIIFPLLKNQFLVYLLQKLDL